MPPYRLWRAHRKLSLDGHVSNAVLVFGRCDVLHEHNRGSIHGAWRSEQRLAEPTGQGSRAWLASTCFCPLAVAYASLLMSSSLWLVSHLVHRYVSRTHIHARTYKAHVSRMITYITLLSALSERSVWTLHSAMLISRVLYFTCVVAEMRGRKTDMQNLVLVYNS